MLIGGMILLPFYAGEGTDFVVNGSLILAFFYLVVIGTSLTFSLYLKGAQMIGGPKASILSCAEPLSSALLSLLLVGHYLHATGLAGHTADSVVRGVDLDGFSPPRQNRLTSLARQRSSYQPGTAPPLKIFSAALATSGD